MDKELEELLRKLEAAQAVSKEQLEFLKKFWEAHPDAAPRPIQPARQISFTDDKPKGDVRTIKAFYGCGPDDEGPSEAPDDPRTYTPAEKELVHFLDNAYIVSTLLGKSPRKLRMWSKFFDRNTALGKALAEATSGSGAEWVPTLLSADAYQMFYLNSLVAGQFPEIAMPSNPYTPPTSFDLATNDGYYYVPESTSDEASKPPTGDVTSGKITLTAKKFKRRTIVSDELAEDAIVPVLPLLRQQIYDAGSRALDNAVINGDTTAPHQDSDVTDPKDIRKIWLGLRKLCPAGTKVDLSTFATPTLQSIRTAMSKWGMTPSDLIWIPGPKSYNKMLGLTEVLTVDKFGPNAVILKGELAALLGVPIVPSEKIRENLNDTGVYDGTTTTKTIILIVNKRGFLLGSRGTAKLTFKEDAEVDQNQLIISFRKAFTAIFDPATYPTIGLAYKIS